MEHGIDDAYGLTLCTPQTKMGHLGGLWYQEMDMVEAVNVRLDDAAGTWKDRNIFYIFAFIFVCIYHHQWLLILIWQISIILPLAMLIYLCHSNYNIVFLVMYFNFMNVVCNYAYMISCNMKKCVYHYA